MRIAVYSDIHGNTPGLDAVCREIDNLGQVDMEVFLGDAVYGGPGAPEIVQRLRDRGTVALRGNHDEDIGRFRNILHRLPESHREAATAWNRWLVERLSADDLEFLATSPLTHRVILPGGERLLFCHSAPDDSTAIFVGPDATEDERHAVLDGISADILCTGHWHGHVFLNWGRVSVYCAGGVGMSPDGLSRWLLIDAQPGAVRVEPRITPYDTAVFERQAAAVDMPCLLHPDDFVERRRAGAMEEEV